MSHIGYFEYISLFSFLILNFIFLKKNKLNMLFFDTLITSTAFALYKYSVTNKIKRMDLHFDSPLIKFINQFISCFVISYFFLLILFILGAFVFKLINFFLINIKNVKKKSVFFIKLIILIIIIIAQWSLTIYKMNEIKKNDYPLNKTFKKD